MADTPPTEAYIITTKNEWPLAIYESERHVMMLLADEKNRAFKCQITVLHEVELETPKPYLKPKESGFHD